MARAYRLGQSVERQTNKPPVGNCGRFCYAGVFLLGVNMANSEINITAIKNAEPVGAPTIHMKVEVQTETGPLVLRFQGTTAQDIVNLITRAQAGPSVILQSGLKTVRD